MTDQEEQVVEREPAETLEQAEALNETSESGASEDLPPAEGDQEARSADEEASEEEPSAAEELSATRALEAPENPNIPRLRPGDAVSVFVLIREGDRERTQEFRGTVIRIRKGSNSASFTVRRTASHGIGVERTFLMRSPLIEKVEIHRRAHVRRAKLYYLRERTGKRARLREKREV